MVLFVVLACLYMLFYRGHPLSIDEISTFDSIKSLSQQDTLWRTVEFYRDPVVMPDGTPALVPLYEPLQIIAGSLLYRLALPFGAVGQFQTVFLLNIVITALTAVSLYIIALRLGYARWTAWLGAFIFGAATLAFPYSRWLFREPLMTLFILWAFAAAFDIRTQLYNRQPIRQSATVLVVCIIGMMLTKQAALLFVPGIFICLMPNLRHLRRYVPIIGLLVAVVGIFLIIISIINPNFGDERYNLAKWINPQNLCLDCMVESFLGYQFSPARSIWLYSPVLLLGFIGIFRLIKKEDSRWLAFGILFTLVLTSAAYGALRLGSYWNGGWNWGPRYMLPIIPLWMLFVLPVIDSVLRAGRLKQLGFGLLILFSVAIQILGIALPYSDFYNLFYFQSSSETRWLTQNWSWGNTAIGYHLQNLSWSNLDSAWRFSRPVYLIPTYQVLVITLALRWGYLAIRRPSLSRRTVYAASAGLMSLFLVGMMLGLLTLRDDGRYIGSRQDVVTLIDELGEVSQPDDVIFLSGNEHMLLFMNRFKAAPRFITLPEEPEMLPPDSLLDEPSLAALQWAFTQTDRVWMVAPSNYALSEEHPRYLERYLSTTLYPQTEILISDYARAVLFATGRGTALAPTDQVMPKVFDERLALTDIQFSTQPSFVAGDSLLLALEWMPTQAIEQDYQLGIQLLNQDRILMSQRDGSPQSRLAKTSQWQIGSRYADHYALVLPEDLPVGRYTLELVVYRLDTLERLLVAGEAPANRVLLTEIEIVESPDAP